MGNAGMTKAHISIKVDVMVAEQNYGKGGDKQYLSSSSETSYSLLRR